MRCVLPAAASHKCNTHIDSVLIASRVCIAQRIPTNYQKRMEDAFNKFDLNHDMTLSVDEVIKVLASLGTSMTHDANSIFESIDLNRDGKITYEEFCDKWTELHLEGDATEWNHASCAWESCKMKFDGICLRVVWGSLTRRTDSAETGFQLGYDIYLEAADVVQDAHSPNIFHITSMTGQHMFHVDDTQKREEWMARLQAAQVSGMTLMKRLEQVHKVSTTTPVGEYMLGDELSGKTGFALAVRRGFHDKTGEPIACKVMPADVALDFKNEIVLQSMLRHPNIISLRDVLCLKDHVYVMMEIASGGDLFARVTKTHGLDEQTARFYFRQLMTGVAYCHSHHVVHRDLKLENVMLANSKNGKTQVLKIIDFGFAKNVAISRVRKWRHYKPGHDHLNCKAVIGTMKYVAPEMLDDNLYDGMKSDIWACGVILYLMVYCSYPFNVGDNGGIGGAGQGSSRASLRLKKQLEAAKLQFKRDEQKPSSKQFQSLLKSMLNKNPASRFTYKDVLRHPWMLEGDSRGKVWSPADAEKLILQHSYAREVIVPDQVSDDPTTWLKAYYENPVTWLEEAAESLKTPFAFMKGLCSCMKAPAGKTQDAAPRREDTHEGMAEERQALHLKSAPVSEGYTAVSRESMYMSPRVSEDML